MPPSRPFSVWALSVGALSVGLTPALKAAVLIGYAVAIAGCGIVGRTIRPDTARIPGETQTASVPQDAMVGCDWQRDHQLAGEQRAWAETAWAYVRENTNPGTGLVNGIGGRAVVTMWDVSDAISAIYAAHELGMIDRCGFDQRFGRLVGSLNTLPLVDDVAPNRFYNAANLTMVGGDNQPAVVGWSAVDLGRLLLWLKIVERRHPAWSEYIGRAVARWNYCRIVDACKSLTAGIHTGPGTYQLTADGRLGYEEYAAHGFAVWGFDTSAAGRIEPSETITVEGVELRRDGRSVQAGSAVAPLTTTPFARYEMEVGTTGEGRDAASYRALGRDVARAQYERFRRTRTMTARTERPLATAPWQVFDSVWAEGYPWNAVDSKGVSAPHLMLLSTTAAFELWSVYPDQVADQVLDHIRALRDPQRGWYAGRFERTGAPDQTLSLRTNAAVLEALLFKHGGVIMPAERHPGWFDLRKQDEFFRPARCLPGEARPDQCQVPIARVSRPLPTRRFRVGARLTAASPALMRLRQAIPGVPQPPEPITPNRRTGWAFNAGLDVPLSYAAVDGGGHASQGEESLRSPRLSLTARYMVRETWFGRMSVHRYLDASRQAPWNPDFTYSFGYDDWRSDTFAFTYDNYGGNRFRAERASARRMTRFEEGTVSAAYKIPVPRDIEAIFVPNPDNRLSASVGVHVTPRFQQDRSAGRGEWKGSLSVAMRNRFYRWFYGELRLLRYFSGSQQQPWDPDFTYGFGYYDWRPGKVSVWYSNYAGNKFRAHSHARGARFRDGSLSVSWNQIW